MLEPLIYCYRIKENGYHLYRNVSEGKWGVLKERDSDYNPKAVKKWYDSRIKAMTAMKRIEKIIVGGASWSQ